MAKIGLENLIHEIKLSNQEGKRESDQLTRKTNINQVRVSADSVVNRTRQKISLEEAKELGRGLSELFSSHNEALEAQGKGLTGERVKALLSDD
ncbi:MAG: hypothetical protein KDD70_05080 [Bdellovibrionales bacterium]|nr:hypothetical protein [Bdellovibrionales bacterium]